MAHRLRLRNTSSQRFCGRSNTSSVIFKLLVFVLLLLLGYNGFQSGHNLLIALGDPLGFDLRAHGGQCTLHLVGLSFACFTCAFLLIQFCCQHRQRRLGSVVFNFEAFGNVHQRRRSKDSFLLGDLQQRRCLLPWLLLVTAVTEHIFIRLIDLVMVL
jgi:hypothetical protein